MLLLCYCIDGELMTPSRKSMEVLFNCLVLVSKKLQILNSLPNRNKALSIPTEFYLEMLQVTQELKFIDLMEQLQESKSNQLIRWRDDLQMKTNAMIKK